MNLWYLLAAPAWFFIIITAASRLADMGRDEWMAHDHVRRLGLIGAGSVATVMLFAPFAKDAWLFDRATWRGAMLAWSWTLVWLTSPNMPPWWDTVLGVHRKTEDWKGLGFLARLKLEWDALVQSFKPRRYR